MSSAAHSRARIWDLPVRLFHWSLVALMVTLFVTAEVMEDAIETHALTGLAMLALVMFRFLWGFAGSSYARFSEFVHGPRVVWRYACALFNARPAFFAGHNPLGGWMVMVFLVLLLLQGGIGLFANDDILFEGPLAHQVSKETSDLLTGLHEELFPVIFLLALVHVGAVVGHLLFRGENLILAMFSGYKELPPAIQAAEVTGGHPLLAALLMAACAALIGWIAQ